MDHITRFAAGILASLALVAAATLSASALTSGSPLGLAIHFVALGGAGVTCTKSTVTGNVGSAPSFTVTQTPTCHIAGNIHQGDATAGDAYAAFTTAYDNLNAKTCPAANNLTSKGDLGGQTLGPGVYCFDKTAALTAGTLTLKGPSSGTWLFQVGTGITTRNAQVLMAGGGLACNVYWVLGTAGTIDTGAKFKGNVLAGSAVNFTGTNNTLLGRALAKTLVSLTGTNNLHRPSNWSTAACRQTP